MEQSTKVKKGSMVKEVVALLKQGVPHDEIVKRVGCSINTVKVQMYKLRREGHNADN